MIVAGMRPRSLTLCPRCRAHARISALRSRPGPVRALRRRPAAPARRAWSVYALNLSCSSLPCAVHTSISYAVPSKENETVSLLTTSPSWGRSQTTVVVIFRATGSSPSAAGSLLRFAKHIPRPLHLTIHATENHVTSCAEYENDGIPEGCSNSP